MNATIDEIFRSGQVIDAEQKAYPHSTATVTRETGVLLYDFVRAIKPERTLEIGMAYGMSTLFLCQAHRDNGGGRHTAIDPYQEKGYRSIGRLNIERARLGDLLQFHETPSDQVLPMLCAQEARIDFAFIDGSHLFDFVMLDFYYVDKLVPVGGCVAFDDLWMPGVRKVVNFVLRNRHYEQVPWPSDERTPLRVRVARACRRIGQNPLGLDWSLKLVSQNTVLLRKTGGDTREWQFHRAF